MAILKSMAAWHTSATSGAAAAAASAAAAAAPNGQAPAPPTAAPTVGEEAVDEAALQSGFMARMAEAGGTEAAEAGGERQAVMLESWKGYKRQFQQVRGLCWAARACCAVPLSAAMWQQVGPALKLCPASMTSPDGSVDCPLPTPLSTHT